MRTRLVFLSACFGMLLFGISLITLGSVAPDLQSKFQLDPVASGALFSLLPFGIMTGSFLFGPFADRYGYKIIMILSCLLMFIGFQGISHASMIVLLKVCVFLFGLGGGAINGACNAVVADISKTNKGANLSLLGVFFAIGALGMPFLLGLLQRQYSFETIVSSVGYGTLLAAALFLFTQFPEGKQTGGIAATKVLALVKEPLLLLIGFFLFCQSSLEGIINNWTTTYLLKRTSISSSEALYALSWYVVGMAVTRVILGSALRKISPSVILVMSFGFLAAGAGLMSIATTYLASVAGLILIGAGLAAGFPIMLGFTGERYAEVSGTAFSIVITIALAGNMVINMGMGFIAGHYGIQHLTTLAFALAVIMLFLGLTILKRIKT